MALLDENGEGLSYAELEMLGNELALQVGGRCLLFSLCTNTIGSVLGYSAFINHNIIPVLLNAHMESELLETLIQKYLPKYLWVPEAMTDRFQDYSQVFFQSGYALLKAKKPVKYEIHEELALLLTTSGSTGSPKFVRQSYENICSNAESIVEYLKLDEAERPITTLPMNYTYGLSIINSHLMVGATILLTDKGLMQKEFWRFFKDQKATSFGGVPYTYEMLDKLRFFQMDLPYLRTMTQAGGKLSPELHKKFAEDAMQKGKQFVVMYGQCEATARMAYLPYERSLEKYGSMGIAIPGGNFRLIGVNNEVIIDAGITGELVYQGANVTLGYAEQISDLAKGDERNGLLYTGDMAKFDEDGYYYIVGRKKRFLKIYGNRVNLDEIDQMIKGKFDSIDCASAGVDDHMSIFITDGLKSDEIRKYIVEKTGLNQVAFKVIVINQIPKNDSGKTLYKDLEQYYQ